MTELYRNDDEVKHFCGMLDGLALLSQDKVQEGMQYLKHHIPQEMDALVQYFDATYVSGTFRRSQPTPDERDAALPPLHLRKIPPRFDIPVWNVHQATIDGRDRMNNNCEGWNTSFASLVGHHHFSFWTAVEALCKDYALIVTQIMQHTRGQEASA